MVLMVSRTFSSPKANIACGVGAKAYNTAVTLFTATSVVCADNKTAMSN
jgi:hypothetical protein